MDLHLFLGAFFLLAALVRGIYLCHGSLQLLGGFIFRLEGSHKRELIELHGLEVVKYLLDNGKGVSLSAFTAIPSPRRRSCV